MYLHVWRRHDRYGTFDNERKLSDREIATLAAWVDDGTPEGDAKDAPPPKEFVEGWILWTSPRMTTEFR